MFACYLYRACMCSVSYVNSLSIRPYICQSHLCSVPTRTRQTDRARFRNGECSAYYYGASDFGLNLLRSRSQSLLDPCSVTLSKSREQSATRQGNNVLVTPRVSRLSWATQQHVRHNGTDDTKSNSK